MKIFEMNRKVLKVLSIILISLMMVSGCSRKEETPQETPAQSQTEQPSEPEKTEEPVKEAEETIEEIPVEEPATEKTDDEVRLNMVFLGRTSPGISLDAILDRAADTLGYDGLSDESDYHLVYGVEGEENNVLLLLPSEKAGLRICAYDNEKEVYYQQEDELPIVYVECADVYNIHTALYLEGSTEKHLTIIDPFLNTLYENENGSSDDIYDLSDYSIFDEQELPEYMLLYEQSLRNDAPGISEDLKGNDFTLNETGLKIIDEHMYQVYEVDPVNGGKKYYCAISYDSENKEMLYLVSSNQKSWYIPGGE